MTITILVAVYNAGKYLRQCLDSLCEQTYKNIQIVCIDDCSTDSSPAILNEYAKRDNRVTIMRTTTNSGQAEARYMGLQAAQGEYTAFLDSDDWLASDSIAVIAAALTGADNIDCALFRLINYYEAGDTCEGGGTYEDYPTPIEPQTILTGEEAFRLSLDWTIHGVMAVRTDIYKACPPGRQRSLYDDELLTRRQLLHSRRVITTSAPYYYRRHGQSTTQAFTVRRFDIMDSHLSLRQLIEDEGLTGLLRPVEKLLWLTIVDCYMLYRDNKQQLSDDERKTTEARFAAMLTMVKPGRLPWRLRVKFGYIPVRSYSLFSYMEDTYSRLRSLYYRIRHIGR